MDYYIFFKFTKKRSVLNHTPKKSVPKLPSPQVRFHKPSHLRKWKMFDVVPNVQLLPIHQRFHINIYDADRVIVPHPRFAFATNTSVKRQFLLQESRPRSSIAVVPHVLRQSLKVVRRRCLLKLAVLVHHLHRHKLAVLAHRLHRTLLLASRLDLHFWYLSRYI